MNRESKVGLGRRDFLAGAAAAAASGTSAVSAAGADIPVIDTHCHIYDPRRPQGAPYTGPRDQPPVISMPDHYIPLAKPEGIVGAVVIEASPWIEDNLWVLMTVEPYPIFVGTVGNLKPTDPSFPEYLGRYHKNPLFRGIRYSRLTEDDGGKPTLLAGMADGLKLLAQADLSLDMANPTIRLLRACVAASDAVPDLRIVMDHMPSLDPTPETQADYDALTTEMSQRPNVAIKLSQTLHKVNGAVAFGLAAHKDRLDHLTELFGEDRVMFGSDWSNSVGTATLHQNVALAREYWATKPRNAAEKFFWKNSARVYKWVKRAADQPNPAGHPQGDGREQR